MRLVSCLAAWGPYDEQKDTLDYSDTLESGFSICFSDVFAGQKVTVKEVGLSLGLLARRADTQGRVAVATRCANSDSRGCV